MKYADLKTKKAKIAHIRKMLGTNINWASKGVIRIFENQTADEQNVEETREHNGIGFTGVDANILSSFAKQIIKGRSMSPKQQAILFKKMPKYAAQLERMTRDAVKEQPVETEEDWLASRSDDELNDIFDLVTQNLQNYDSAENYEAVSAYYNKVRYEVSRRSLV